MERAVLQDVIRKGLGRGILWAREGKLGSLGDVVLEECLESRVVGSRIFEGTRASYLYELLGFLPDKEEYYEKLVESLGEAQDDWSGLQRFQLVAYLAEDGNEKAQAALRGRGIPGPEFAGLIGICLVKAEGIAGMMRAAAQIGNWLLAGRNVEVGYLHFVCEDDFGEDTVKAALLNGDEAINAYMQAAYAPMTREPGNAVRQEAQEGMATPYSQLWTTQEDVARGLCTPEAAIRIHEQAYEHGHCSWCREFAVRRLLDLGALREEWRQECFWDAREEIRELVGAHSA